MIEQDKNCKFGRKLELSSKLVFHENVTDGSKCLCQEGEMLLENADICIMSGALQYFSHIQNYSANVDNLPYPNNQIEYRNLLYKKCDM